MKTKSISLLLVLALCITIGGVYATWIYAETPITNVHSHIGSFGLANAQVNNSKGTISIDASGAHLYIDQKDTVNLDYTAVLTATGTITVTFTPSNHFVAANDTISLQYNLKTDNANPTNFVVKTSAEDAGKPLFTAFDTATKTTLDLVKQGDGTYVATVQATALLPLITLNDFELNNYDMYTYFSGQIGSFGNIGFEVSEVRA